MTLRLASWNVNSLRQRIDHLARFASEVNPDVICLQETKVRDDDFPAEAIRAMGYDHQLVHGQKSYNGVAILSRRPFDATATLVWCGKNDRRHASVRFGDLEIHNFYVPSGGSVPDPAVNDKFAHKLKFLKEMAAWVGQEGLKSRQAVLLGDMNVAPLESDVWNHKRLLRSVGHSPVESAHMAAFLASAELMDVPRHFTPEPAPLYTWWGYRFPQAFDLDYGWRLDHVLATPPLAGAVTSLKIFKSVRGWDKPSDHVPVVVEIA